MQERRLDMKMKIGRHCGIQEKEQEMENVKRMIMAKRKVC